MAIARKKVGPIVPTAEKISNAGCANSFRLTTQLYSGSEHIWHQGTSDVLDMWRNEGPAYVMLINTTNNYTEQNNV